ncbi:MAG: sugar phosphate isomerase/epimerase [Ruminococcaceae bacterium]|nr:sugar phosphate isomerase/epimerase [Oscillospiraceae bacterium]
MRFAVSSYSFSQAIRSGNMTQADCVEKAKEMGFEGVEFTDLAGGSLEEQKKYAFEIKERASKAGIEVVAYTIGANLYSGSPEKDKVEVERLKAQVDVAAALGVSVMRHDACWNLTGIGAGRSFDGMLPTIAENARKISEYAMTKGIRTCTENHGFLAQDSDRMERLFNAVGHENYGLLVDIGNFSCVDEDNASAVSRVAPYAFHVHAKDMLLLPEGVKDLPCTIQTRGCRYIQCTWIGNGSVVTKRCLAILKKAGYDGWVSVEYEGAEDCFYGIAKGLENLKKYVLEI